MTGYAIIEVQRRSFAAKVYVFSDEAEAEAAAVLLGNGSLLKRGDHEMRAGPTITADVVTKDELNAERPNFTRDLAALVEQRAEEKAENERRKAEQLEQQRKARWERERQERITHLTEQKRQEAELAQIKTWEAQAAEQVDVEMRDERNAEKRAKRDAVVTSG